MKARRLRVAQQKSRRNEIAPCTELPRFASYNLDKWKLKAETEKMKRKAETERLKLGNGCQYWLR